MGRDSHLSASASQIYPSASPPPPPRHSASTAHSHSDTFQLNPVSPSSNEDESGHATARRIRVLNFGRLALTVLSIAVAAAVVGCEAHGLNVYNLTRLNDGFFLPPLWPRGLDLRPTQGMVVGGAVAALAGLVYVLVGVVPVPGRFKLFVVLFSTSLSIIGLAGSVFGVAYSTSITSRSGYDRDNIQSWTCRWVDGAADAEKLFANGLAAIMAPEGFKRVCMETHVGFSLLAILICLETVVLVVTGLCAWLEVRMRRSEKGLVGGELGEKGVTGRRFY